MGKFILWDYFTLRNIHIVKQTFLACMSFCSPYSGHSLTHYLTQPKCHQCIQYLLCSLQGYYRIYFSFPLQIGKGRAVIYDPVHFIYLPNCSRCDPITYPMTHRTCCTTFCGDLFTTFAFMVFKS